MTHPNTSPDSARPSRTAARPARAGLLRGALAPLGAALALAAAGLCAAPPALALTVANVDVPEQQSVAGSNLVLNGAGLRQRFVFHVYVAALYRPQPTKDAEAILNSPEPQMLRLTLLRDINSKALTDALNDGLKANCTEAELKDMADTIAHFEAFMKTGGEGASGDRVDIVFNQGTVSVSFKGKALGEVKDPRFATALLKVWLGAHPAQESLKAALLGQESKSN
ncbi:chalcone isomerase family protein [Castellaniella sp.]|uniref:chalcone isomerase family protein n=1 Tax=Castellaniella sp. TaxID=1955812 RepID=UPI002AFEF50D|nr:chalcone isomerase family protein [Castellaniella sp.]